jgi:hypothetical protein
MSVFGAKPDRFIFHGGAVVAVENKDGWSFVGGAHYTKRARPDFIYDTPEPPNKVRRLNEYERDPLMLKIKKPKAADFLEEFREQTLRNFGRSRTPTPSGGDAELK